MFKECILIEKQTAYLESCMIFLRFKMILFVKISLKNIA